MENESELTQWWKHMAVYTNPVALVKWPGGPRESRPTETQREHVECPWRKTGQAPDCGNL